eukprot:IDg19543t1
MITVHHTHVVSSSRVDLRTSAHSLSSSYARATGRRMSSMSMSTAFTASCARVASARTIAFAGNRLCARPVVVRRARGAARMAAEEKKPESDVSNPKRTQMEEEADTPLSVWG